MSFEASIRLRPLTELGPEIGGKGKDQGRRTIGRRMRDDPDFPPVAWINGRGFVNAPDWECYKQILFRRGLERDPHKTMAPDDVSNKEAR